MPVIYLDVLLALNLFIDFLLLSATSKILRLPHKRGRLVLGALFGSACSCMIFLPDFSAVISLFLKIICAGLIIRIAFRWQSSVIYIKQLAVFLITSAVFGGLCYAIWFFAAPSGFYVVGGVVYYNVSPLALTLLTVVSYLAITLYDRFTHKKVPDNHNYCLILDCGEREVCLRALYDTGHHVTDVFTGSPVALVSQHAIEPYLSEDLRCAIDCVTAEKIRTTPRTATTTAVRTHLRMIPFHSVGGTGLLPAFRPQHMSISPGYGISPAQKEQGKCRDITGAYVAVCDTVGRGEYDAIIGTDIVSILEGSHLECKHGV